LQFGAVNSNDHSSFEIMFVDRDRVWALLRRCVASARDWPAHWTPRGYRFNRFTVAEFTRWRCLAKQRNGMQRKVVCAAPGFLLMCSISSGGFNWPK